jgi:hypothetical protein
MEEKNDRGRTAAMDEALEAGYRASRSLGTAIRRADDTTSLPVRNGLGQAEESLEAALFALEEVRGVEGSVGRCAGDCGEFVARYRKALSECGLDLRSEGTLRDGLEEAEATLEGLSLLVDGYHSFKEDDI